MTSIKARIVLKGGKDDAIKRFHPWVFSGAIKKIDGVPGEGDTVEVFSNKDEFLGIGHYQTQGSISVRLFSFERTEPDENFWRKKLQQAIDYRKDIGLFELPETNVFRLVFAEGDNMPGLIVDYYNGTAVIQAHSAGFYRLAETLGNIIKEILGDKLQAVYCKSKDTLPAWYSAKAEDGYLLGSKTDGIVKEYGIRFFVDWEEGQKTGFFIDQRENRRLLSAYSKGKNVLNTFCYSGGFSLYALEAGATLVHSVDSSKKAIELTEKNTALNGHNARHQSFLSDSLDFIQQSDDRFYDIIILDPPAFAKHQDVRHNAVQGYKRLNAAAIRKIKKNGLLFTFSCSQAIDRSLFQSTVIAAAIQEGRRVRIIHHLSQPVDHPVSAFHPEGEYLKGLVLFVE